MIQASESTRALGGAGVLNPTRRVSRDHRPTIVVGAVAVALMITLALTRLEAILGLDAVSLWVGAFGVVVVGVAGTVGMAALRGGDLSFAMMMGCHAYWFALPAALTVLGGRNIGHQPGIPPLHSRHISQALFMVVVFIGVTWLAYAGSRRRLSESGWARIMERRLSGSGMRQEPTILFMLFVGLVPFFVFGGDIGSIVAGILSSRSVERGWATGIFSSNPLMVAGRAALALSAALALDLLVRHKRRKLWVVLAFLVAFAVTYLDSGTRTWVALMLGPTVLLAIRGAIRRGILGRWLVIGPVLVMSVVWLTEAQRAFRTQGVQAALPDVEFGMSDTDFFTETAVAASVVPEQFDYVRESVTVLFLTNPIPRLAWPTKPYPRVIQVYGIGRRGFDEFLNAGTSSMPSIVGQFHMSWGWLGVVEAGLIIGMLFALVGALWENSRPGSWAEFAGAVSACWVFTAFRVMLPGFHYTPLLLIIGLLLWRGRRPPGQVARAPEPGPARSR